MGNATSSLITSDILVSWQLNLIDQLTNYTLTYIGIAVTLILASGGLIYLFSLRPFERELQRQSNELKTSRESLQQMIEVQLSALKIQINDMSGIIDSRVSDLLSEAERNIITKASAESSIGIAQARADLEKASKEISEHISDVKENLIKEVRILEDRLAQSATVQAEHTQKLGEISRAQLALERTNKDIEFRVRELETYKYSKEGKRGSYLVPLETLEEVCENGSQYDITQWLKRLKEGIANSVLDADEIVRINKVLAKIPAEFKLLKEEITEVIMNNSKPKSVKPSIPALTNFQGSK